ncbi:MAG: alpha-2-macroglobulin family protein [Sphingobacteriales bacterium]|nr:alpha-2-macroglobulin family protein [Sphingobacteriales bacterium]
MKPFHLLLCFLTASLFFFPACKQHQELRIVATNFKKEISPQQNLRFTFNRDLATEAQIEKWDSTAYIRFEPQVKGAFRWVSANELIFSPNEGFPASTDIVGTATSEIFKNSEKPYKLGKESVVEFHTPYLRLDNVYLQWRKSKTEPGAVALQANLAFNYPMQPAEVADHLAARIDDDKIPIQVISDNTNKHIVSEMLNADRSSEQAAVRIEVAKGIKTPEGHYRSPDNFSAELPLPDKSRIDISSIYTEHDGINGTLYVVTSQEISNSDLAGLVSVSPEVEIKVQPSINGFTVESNEFSPMTDYELRINGKLQGVIGAPLGNDYKNTFNFGKPEPTLRFTEQAAIYMSAQGNRNLDIDIINVPKIVVQVVKVFENNIAAFMRNGESYDYYSANDYDYFDFSYYDTQKYGQNIYTDTISTENLPLYGSRRLLHLDFKDKLPQWDGFYVVRVSSAEHLWITDSKLVSISDIGLIAKADKNNVYVFANSIKTAKSLADIDVSFISTNNQKLTTLKTDSKGIAVLEDVDKKFPGFKIGMITAKKGEDYNFLWFDNTLIDVERFELGGKYPNEAGYDAFLYGERNIYRPGETVHIAGIVRDEANLEKIPADMPVKIKWLNPAGKEIKTLRKVLNQEGSFDINFALPATAATGTYRAELYSANDILLHTKPISVEEFMPERIRVNVNLPQESLTMADSLLVQIDAANYFGPPAANNKYEVEVQLKRGNFSPKGYKNFIFKNNNESYLDNLFSEGACDAQGKVLETFSWKPELQDMGLLKGKVYATVFDESARPVHRSKEFELYTQDVFYGIGNLDYFAAVRKPLQIPLIALTPQGKPTSATADLQVIRYDWKSSVERNQRGNYSYNPQREEVVVSSKEVRFDGDITAVSFTPEVSGEYEVRIQRKGAKNYVSQRFYAYSYGNTLSTSFEVNREGTVEIELDKEKYQVGDEVKALLKTPFSGKMLVTVEQNRVLKHFYIETDKKSAEISFDLSDAHAPNCFITATLFKPHINNDLPMFVAHGYKNLIVSNAEQQLPLSISTATQARSKQKHAIDIQTAPRAQVSVAVVDEGILALKNYKTPDPLAFFGAPRALGVQSYDLYALLYPELRANLLSGGDGYEAADADKRLNPLSNKRIKPVSFWSGLLTADASGKIHYEIDVPQFSGEVRVMAVAVKQNRYAAADTAITIADPIVISSGAPRVLAFGDTLRLPVSLSNTTDKATQGTAKISVKPPLMLLGESSKTVSIPAKGSSSTEFLIYAQNGETAAGSLQVSVQALGETFTENIDLPVRAATSLQKIAGNGALKGGTQQKNSLNTTFIPASVSGKLLISRLPVVEFGKHLEYVVTYPYGCAEQTLASAFPQIYYPDLAQKILRSSNAINDPNPAYNVQQAIYKLQNMQLYSGAISYWQGGEQPNWWVTAQTLHFWYEAQKAGFDVSRNAMETAKYYLQERLSEKSTQKYYYNNNEVRDIMPKEVAYSLFVLALLNEPNIAEMNALKENTEKLSLDSRYVLAATYRLVGDVKTYKSLLPEAFASEQSVPQLGGALYSPTRDLALALYVLAYTDPTGAEAGSLSRLLSQELKDKAYLNTQEITFSLLALGQMARLNKNNTATADIYANGKKIAQFTGEDLVLNYSDIKANQVEIRSNGNGTLYYFWEMQGLSNSNIVPEADRNLKIVKHYYNRYGQPINPSQLKQNDLVVIGLEVVSLQRDAVPNVAITDVLPAAFEVENPRLSELPALEWAKNKATPESFDIRDDRILFFDTVTKAPKAYYYMARVVSKGTFAAGTYSADAMYSGDYYSTHGGGILRVQ